MSVFEKVLKKKREEEDIDRKKTTENLIKNVYETIKTDILNENVYYYNHNGTLRIDLEHNAFMVIDDVVKLLKEDKILPNNVTYRASLSFNYVIFGIDSGY